MLQMIKIFHYTALVSIIFIFNINLSNAGTRNQRPRIFLYQSKLPKTIYRKKRELRSHVIDVILSTQKYDVVFSKIPKLIAPGLVRQNILKYKLRTSTFAKSLFNIEFTLIDADSVRILKTIKYIDIPKSKLLYQFRLHLYEFILGKKLSNSREKEFNKISKRKITRLETEDKIKSLTSNLKKNDGSLLKTIQQKSMSSAGAKNSKLNSNKNSPKNISSIKLKKTLTLWDLLKDYDIDPTWEKDTISNRQKAKSEKSLVLDSNKSSNNEKSNIKGPPNPFLKTRISIKEDEQEDIRIDMFHAAWRVAKRDQEVTDLVSLTNNFTSVIGLTFEWVIHNPLAIQNLFFRTGFEVDKSLKTEPIKLSDHSLFRIGTGFKLPFNLLPSIYLETNSLVFANLNTAGGGFQDNIVSIYWSTIELAYLTERIYFGLQYSQSIDTSTLLEGVNFANLQGQRVGLNLRYFSDFSIFSLNLWADAEYRVESFNATNLDLANRKLEVIKEEIAIKIGFFF